MAARVVLLLGRTIWVRDGGAWKHESIDSGPNQAARAIERLADFLSISFVGRTIVVFEPEGMAHQVVETPKASRSIFSTLARVRSEHPVVTSENLGWGIEIPEPGASGEFTTQLHSELTPGLIHLCRACEHSGSRLTAAWSACSAASSNLGSAPSTRPRFALILAPGFCCVATAGGGKRPFKAWVGTMSDRDWRTFAMSFGDSDARPTPTMSELDSKRGGIVVIAGGDPALICPLWSEIRESGRVEAIFDFDVFAERIARIPAKHPANLVEAFPRPLELDIYLGAAAVVSLIAAATLWYLALSGWSAVKADRDLSREQLGVLRERLDALTRNQREMAQLRNEVPSAPGSTVGNHDALVALSSAIPDALTLNSFKIGHDGGFELEALVVGSGFNQDDTRQMLARRGFSPSQGGGWTYDSAKGKLEVKGSYREATK